MVKVGLQYSTNANTTITAIGASGAGGDARQQGEAVIGYINKHGGVAGRKLVGAYNNVDATASPADESQQACAQWTQDDHVTLAMPQSVVEDNNLMRTCLGKANVPAMLMSIFSTVTAADFGSSPLWAELNSTSVDSYAKTYIQGLASQGFFKNGKIGVVYNEKEPFKSSMASVFLPELKKVGVSKVFTYAASASGANDLSSGSSQMSSAVLNFRSNGVDRVLFFEPWVGYFAFLQAAKSQGYHPSYGFTSQEGPAVMVQLGLISTDQLVGSHLVSWQPLGDLASSKQYRGPRVPLCTQIYRSAGVPLATDAAPYGAQMQVCESLLLVQDAYRNAGRQLKPADFINGLQSLGTGVQQAGRQFAEFSPSQHWATSKYWNGHWDTAKNDYVFDNGPHPMK